MKSFFYKTTNKINGKYYYGSGCKNNYIGSGIKLLEAIEKYGKESFEFTILKYFDSRDEAYEFEDRFLHLYDLMHDPMAYNVTNRGNGGNRLDYDGPSGDLYRAISKENLVNWNKSKKSRNSNSKRMTENNPMDTTESKEKSVNALNNYRAENGPYWTGKNRSEECKHKIGQTRKQRGIEPYNKGKTLPREIECKCGKMFTKQGYKRHINTCNG
jgi:hypothetical protein